MELGDLYFVFLVFVMVLFICGGDVRVVIEFLR